MRPVVQKKLRMIEKNKNDEKLLEEKKQKNGCGITMSNDGFSREKNVWV